MNERIQTAINDLLHKWRHDPPHYMRHQHDVSDMSHESVGEVIAWLKANEGPRIDRIEVLADEETGRRHLLLWPKKEEEMN